MEYNFKNSKFDYDFTIDKTLVDMKSVCLKYLEDNDYSDNDLNKGSYDLKELDKVRKNINHSESISIILKNWIEYRKNIIQNNESCRTYIDVSDIKQYKNIVLDIVYVAFLLIKEIDKYQILRIGTISNNIKKYASILEELLVELTKIIRTKNNMSFIEELYWRYKWYHRSYYNTLINLLYFAKIENEMEDANIQMWDEIKDDFFIASAMIDDYIGELVEEIVSNILNNLNISEDYNSIDKKIEEEQYILEMNPILSETSNDVYYDSFQRLGRASNYMMYICTIDNKKVNNVNSIIKGIDNIMKDKKITGWSKYTIDGSKKNSCFALMKVAYNSSSIAKLYFVISGLHDDDEICKRLGWNGRSQLINLIENNKLLKRIQSNEIDTKIVVSCEDICSYRYLGKKKYILKNALNDYDKCKDDQKKIMKECITKNFSCCERKLFAYIFSTNKPSVKKIDMYIKYSPCDDCRRVINNKKRRIEIYEKHLI